MSERKCSNARSLLVLKWTVIGFLVTLSYKSVLRAILMKTEYDAPIDTIEDVLTSDRQFMVIGDSPLKRMVETDERANVKALAKKVKYYNYNPDDQAADEDIFKR